MREEASGGEDNEVYDEGDSRVKVNRRRRKADKKFFRCKQYEACVCPCTSVCILKPCAASSTNAACPSYGRRFQTFSRFVCSVGGSAGDGAHIFCF